jgi:hypothetical protein
MRGESFVVAFMRAVVMANAFAITKVNTPRIERYGPSAHVRS